MIVKINDEDVFRAPKTSSFNHSNMNTFCKILFICSSVVYVVACDRPVCFNENPVFDQSPPDSKMYKDELAYQLKQVDRTNLTYWFDKYEEKEGKEYIHVLIQGNGLCAKGVITVKEWNKLGKIRQTKGLGFRGAKLKKLCFDIYQDALVTEFIYRSIDAIID